MTSSSETPTVLARKYELLELAGEGGMAKVWRARMVGAAGFSRPVAVKRILSHLVDDSEFIAMFVEEARVGSQLQHPNIVQIIDFDVDDDGVYFLVMEWVEGLGLGNYLEAFAKAGLSTPWPLVTAIGIEVLRGLGAAHDRLDDQGERSPVIHRDVTPQNILVGVNGVVKLSDFGLSRAMDRARMTHPDIVKGKLGYLAPEISHGAEASITSDIFSFGVALWEALAGRQLYQGSSDIEIFLAARKAEIPPLGELRDDLPPALVKTIERALRHDPEQRFKSAHHMRRSLATILRKWPIPTDSQVVAFSVRDACRVLAGKKESPPPTPSSRTAQGELEVVVPIPKRDDDA